MTKFLDLAGLVALWNKIKNTFVRWADTSTATTISIDSTPTSNSTNLITSGGVYGSIPKDYEIDYSKRYLTIVSLEDNNTIGWKASNANLLKTISVSTDLGKTWTEKTSSTVATILATLDTGDKLLIKGSNTVYANNSHYNYFTSTGNFNVEGNIMSLIYGDNFIDQITLDSTGYNFKFLFYGCTKLISVENLILPATTLAECCYDRMFQNCTSLTAIPELPATTLAETCYSGMFRDCTSLKTVPKLPATTLASGCYAHMFNSCTSLIKAPELPATTLVNSCYYYMFNGCTSLTTASELPATTLAENCCFGMFYGCTSLTTAPKLPATTLTYYCYAYMFQNCTSLTIAPELPATTLSQYCYQNMFKGCTKLNYIKCLATNIPANNCTNNWVQNVSLTGTFIKADNMTSWTIGESGIPSNWNIYAKEYTLVDSVSHTFIKNVSSGRDLRIWIDDFSDVSRMNIYENYLLDLADKCYIYSGDTLTINNTVHYIWKGISIGDYDWVSDKAYILTTTNDYNTLYSQSLADDINNDFTSFAGYLNEDLEDSYVNNELGEIYLLVDIHNNNGTLSISFDNLNIEDLEGGSISDFNEDPEESGCNPYEITNNTITLDGETYYVWIYVGDYSNAPMYLLTTSNDYEELSSEVLTSEYDIGRPNSIYAVMDSDNNISYSIELNWALEILKVEEL